MRAVRIIPLLITVICAVRDAAAATCRNVPGDHGFPSNAEWKALNLSISGRLVPVVPSAKFCSQLPSGSCTEAQWASANFRNTIPGAMNQVNWEQDYDSVPPSLCFRDSVKTCGQGNVPLFSVEAESADDIQKGVKFAQSHNIRLAIKASGHDYLGRSTAKSSLLIRTHKLQNIAFTDHFFVGKHSKGSAVTVGSGVGLSTLYTTAKTQGKIVVGGTASTVVAAGGYTQGAGHSALSPTFGLAADNALEFHIVVANGNLLKVNEVENSDFFWALRGGGAGSWGVIVNATFRTFPTFNAVVSNVTIITTSNSMMGRVSEVHARHIFDWDTLGTGQYFYIFGPVMNVLSFFTRASVAQVDAALEPFIRDVKALGATVISGRGEININDALAMPDDAVGDTLVLGSRLIPTSVYMDSPEVVGQVYTELLNSGATNILGNLVAGGQVSANANISSAINPAWRTAKTHVIIGNLWPENGTAPVAHAGENQFKTTQLPILQKMTGGTSAAYSNEADSLEDDFRGTFFGSNFARLSKIKKKYDPNDLFIVAAGVGSERWDKPGLCKI